MSYGQNQPWGLVPIKTITGAPWNGQTNPYLIQSGYALNIFRGDLVYLGDDGFIHNLAEAVNYGTAQALGVFDGCSYVTTTAINPIDPASPGKMYWPASAVTLNNQVAIANIIDDPSVVFNIQSGAAGVPFTAQGSNASVGYTLVNNNPQGNFSTGVSSVILNVATIAAGANLNLKILRFVNVDGNPSTPNETVPYNNVEVLIQNHSFAQRAAGHA